MESTRETTETMTPTAHGADATAAAGKTAVVTLRVNADDLCTSQQKRIDFARRRVFPNPKVLKGMKLVLAKAKPYAPLVAAAVPHGSPVAVDALFFVPYPKGTPRRRLVDGVPMPEKWDLDNKWKSVGDALTLAGWWPDDRFITSLRLRKRRTVGPPLIILAVSRDATAESLAAEKEPSEAEVDRIGGL